MWKFLVPALVLVAAAVVGLRLRQLRRPAAKLALREGTCCGMEFALRGREITIGSSEEQRITISHPRVSRLHAVVSRDGDRFLLRDESSYGVQVNGKPVSEAVELRSGDLIRLGESVDLIFTRLIPPRTR